MLLNCFHILPSSLRVHNTLQQMTSSNKWFKVNINIDADIKCLKNNTKDIKSHLFYTMDEIHDGLEITENILQSLLISIENLEQQLAKWNITVLLSEKWYWQEEDSWLLPEENAESLKKPAWTCKFCLWSFQMH